MKTFIILLSFIINLSVYADYKTDLNRIVSTLEGQGILVDQWKKRTNEAGLKRLVQKIHEQENEFFDLIYSLKNIVTVDGESKPQKIEVTIGDSFAVGIDNDGISIMIDGHLEKHAIEYFNDYKDITGVLNRPIKFAKTLGEFGYINEPAVPRSIYCHLSTLNNISSDNFDWIINNFHQLDNVYGQLDESIREKGGYLTLNLAFSNHHSIGGLKKRESLSLDITELDLNSLKKFIKNGKVPGVESILLRYPEIPKLK